MKKRPSKNRLWRRCCSEEPDCIHSQAGLAFHKLPRREISWHWREGIMQTKAVTKLQNLILDRGCCKTTICLDFCSYLVTDENPGCGIFVNGSTFLVSPLFSPKRAFITCLDICSQQYTGLTKNPKLKPGVQRYAFCIKLFAIITIGNAGHISVSDKSNPFSWFRKNAPDASFVIRVSPADGCRYAR